MPIFLRIPLVLEVASDLTHGLKRNVIQLITEQFNFFFFFFCIFVFQSWVTPRVHLSNLETAVLGNPHLPKAKISFLIQNSDPLKSLKKGTGFFYSRDPEHLFGLKGWQIAHNFPGAILQRAGRVIRDTGQPILHSALQ